MVCDLCGGCCSGRRSQRPVVKTKKQKKQKAKQQARMLALCLVLLLCLLATIVHAQLDIEQLDLDIDFGINDDAAQDERERQVASSYFGGARGARANYLK